MCHINYLRMKALMFVFIVLLLHITASHFIEYPETIELIQQRAGYDIKLQCGLKDQLIDEDSLNQIIFHWFFKQCGESVKNCTNMQENDWIQLPCEENFCKSDLHLKNITEKYSGLYKCAMFPHASGNYKGIHFKLTQTYQLDVRNYDGIVSAPEFLDVYPTNKTVSIGSQVVFQCRIYSEVPPTIKWFRRVSSTYNYKIDYPHINGNANFNAHIVKYNDYTYELLSSAREKLVSVDTYLSKLLLYNVNSEQIGYYACVAINYGGHKIREAFLNTYIDSRDGNFVDSNSDYWSDYEEEIMPSVKTDPSEFVLLFLMPVGLALLPVTFWLCYIIFKRCRNDVNTETDCDNQYLQGDTLTTDKTNMLRT